MGIVRENHPAKTQRVNEIEIIERWVAKTKKRINRLKTTVHGKQRKVPKTIHKIICTPMEGSYIKLTNQNRDQTIVNVYKNNSDDTLSLLFMESEFLGPPRCFCYFSSFSLESESRILFVQMIQIL